MIVSEPRVAPEMVGQSEKHDQCMACASAEYATVGPVGTGFATEVDGQRFYQPEYESRRCQRCGLVFKSATASAVELDEYYQRVDYRKWECEGLYPTERRVVAALRELPLRSRILDFGCSSGRLLGELVSNYECFGCEINPHAAQRAIDRGMTILDWDELVNSSAARTFDAIVLVDVFEHLTNPLDLLRALVGRLTDGGRLTLCSGDSDAPAVRGEPSTFWYFHNIEHVCMLNRQHVTFLANHLGLEIAGVEQLCHYDVAQYIRLKQAAANLAYEVFHCGRAAWLKPLFLMLPGFRKARRWHQRPGWSTTADHLVVVFQKRCKKTA